MPPALAAKPDPPLELSEALRAFQVLSEGRQSTGFGPAKISLTEFESYNRMFGAPAMDLDIFLRLIRAMDAEFMKVSKQRHDNESV